MNICVFEDVQVINLFPLTYLRPVYELRCGCSTLLEKVTRYFADHYLYLHCRPYLKGLSRQNYPQIPVNNLNTGHQCLLLNGRVLMDNNLYSTFVSETRSTLYVSGKNLVAALLSGEDLSFAASLMEKPLDTMVLFQHLRNKIAVKEISARMISYPWDLLQFNREEINNNFQNSPDRGVIAGEVHHQAVILGEENVAIGPKVTIDPFVVIDARKGPVCIGSGTQVSSHCLLEGPISIGADNRISNAVIRSGTCTGPQCKLGGEVSNSIFHGFSNKGHEGFVGDSVIGSWVNLGALTTTSNLKNNYGSIRMKIGSESIDSNLQFLGSVIGDYTKTAIGTLLNTGTVIGIFCNVFRGVPGKYLPSFSWGDAETEYRLTDALNTADDMSGRRQISISEEEKELIRVIYRSFSSQRTSV